MTATAAAAAATPRLANPYAKRSQTAVNNSVNMSPQSQQRISNQHKRKYKLCSNSQKWQKGDQLTLEGGIAFEATRDCIACKARHLATFLQGYRVPNRPHHVLCVRNTKTRGKGEISDQQRISLEDNKRYKNLVRPFAAEKKGSSRNLPSNLGKAYFAPRNIPAKMTTPSANDTVIGAKNDLSPKYFFKAVTQLVENKAFAKQHKNKMAPLAIMAFAEELAENIIFKKRTHEIFSGIAMEIPHCEEAYNNPHYQTIVGQKLLCVDWEHSCGL